jgi:hypothetical protein
MTLSSRQNGGPFSIQHSFVVQFASHTGFDKESLEGRIEHLVSGKSAHFQSLEHLHAFVIQVLAASRTP